MDIQGARKKAQITDEERAAVANYIEYGHTQKNSLAGFNVLDYLQASRRGWHLSGAERNNNKTSEEISSEIFSSIEDFVNIYSAMVKYMYENPLPNKLMRGTSVKEASSLREGETYDKLLSTTTDQTTAMSFGDAYDAAFLRINTGDGIPFINVSDFVGEENLNRDEQEYILAPFLKIKSARFTSNWNGYKYYDIALEKPQLRQFGEGEKDKFASTIKAEFLAIITLGKEYQKLEDEYETICRRMQSTRDREDLAYMAESRRDIFNRMAEIKPKMDKFSVVMKNYIQGLCVEKEQEYLEAYEACRAEDRRIREEERRIAEEERRKDGISDFKKRVETFQSSSQETPRSLHDQYQKLRDEEQRYMNFARKLGVPFELSIDKISIEQSLDSISNNIVEMRKRVEKVTLGDTANMPEVESALTTVIEYNEKLRRASRSTTELTYVTEEYSKEAFFVAKKSTDEKGQVILKNIKLRLLEAKKKQIQDRRISFWGKMRGLDKLKNAELEGIDLEIQLLKIMPIQQKESYSIRDTLADMRVFSINELSGKMTPEMQSFEDVVRGFFVVDERAIDTLVASKLNAHPIVVEPQKRWESTSSKIARVVNKNEELRNGIYGAQYSVYNTQSINTYNPQNPRNRFLETLRDIEEITTLPDEQGNEVRGKTSVQSMDDSYVK